MSLAHAILGFLERQAMTGYDLKTQCFDVSVTYFWPADQAQIYRTLDKMEDEGWVTSQLEIQRDRPNRKLYSLTEAGGIELRRWLMSTQPLPVHREPYLVQLFFSEHLEPSKIIESLLQQRALHDAQLQAYYANRKQFAAKMRTRELTLAELTLDLGIRTEEAYVNWIDESIKKVRDML